MKAIPLLTLGYLIGGHTASQAALTLTFTEEAAGVVMTVNGSVNLSTGVWVNDFFSQKREFNLNPNGVTAQDTLTGTDTFEVVAGVDLLTGNLANTDIFRNGVAISGSGDFSVLDTFFTAFRNTDPGIRNDDNLDATITASNRVIRWNGETFSSMELDNHALNVTHDLWALTAGALETEKVSFIVSGVPEPSSTALLGLGSFALVLRRKRLF